MALLAVPTDLHYNFINAMKISIKGYIYHKEAETFLDCFDRYGFNKNTNKFAISDGVSKSFFPDIWAELLVESFVTRHGRIDMFDFNSYKEIQVKWEKRVEEIVNKPTQKYYVRNFFMQGRSAAATFIGLHFFNSYQKVEWEAMALGDSYLFFVPEYIKNINSNLNEVIHLSSKKDFEFNNFPDYFDSRNEISKGKINFKRNDLRPGTFYLMTDALAEWFVKQKQEAIYEILGWRTQNDFEKSINRLRKYDMQNDDSSILIITVESDNSMHINYSDILVTDLSKLKIKENEKSVYTNPSLNNKGTQTDITSIEPNKDIAKDKNYFSEDFSELDRDVIKSVLIELEKRKDKLSTWELAKLYFFFSKISKDYAQNKKKQVDWLKEELNEIQNKYMRNNENKNVKRKNNDSDTDLNSITDKF